MNRVRSVLFLGKEQDRCCAKAAEWCVENFDNVEVHLGSWGDPLPLEAREWEGDLIVSYLSRWIVPQYLLERATFAAINFHPASPEYPGIGCVNFALYDEALNYGATCHHMNATVDSGSIIAVNRFDVEPEETVASLLEKTYEHQYDLFRSVMENVLDSGSLPTSDEVWGRRPITRKEFDALFQITPEMPDDEIARRVRAVTFEQWRPYVDLGGRRFVYEGMA